MCALRRGMFNDQLIGKMKKGMRPLITSPATLCSRTLMHDQPHAAFLHNAPFVEYIIKMDLTGICVCQGKSPTTFCFHPLHLLCRGWC